MTIGQKERQQCSQLSLSFFVSQFTFVSLYWAPLLMNPNSLYDVHVQLKMGWNIQLPDFFLPILSFVKWSSVLCPRPNYLNCYRQILMALFARLTEPIDKLASQRSWQIKRRKGNRPPNFCETSSLLVQSTWQRRNVGQNKEGKSILLIFVCRSLSPFWPHSSLFVFICLRRVGELVSGEIATNPFPWTWRFYSRLFVFLSLRKHRLSPCLSLSRSSLTTNIPQFKTKMQSQTK